MEQSRANKISEVLKNVSTLGKNLKIPGGIAQPAGLVETKNAIGVPVQGTGFVRILMYILAGILLIGIILLGVDQWITPVFQRSPGAPGYIPIPGTDTSQLFWPDSTMVRDIIVGPAPTPPPGQTPMPSVTVIEGQQTYSLTLDITIKDEFSQSNIRNTGPSSPLGDGFRTFFVIGQADITLMPILTVSLDNFKNTLYISSVTNSQTPRESIFIDNVPIHKPFRLGITMSTHKMEGYINGLLVQTKTLHNPPTAPTAGNKIFAPSSIKSGLVNLSNGITVLNVRAFGYVVSPAEMKSRMQFGLLSTGNMPVISSAKCN